MESIITKQLPTGLPVNDTPSKADDDAYAHVTVAKQSILDMVDIDTNGTPDMPVADERIETLLEYIIDENITKSVNMYNKYRTCGFPLVGHHITDINNFRVLMRTTRVRERLKFLRESEFELNAPTTQKLSTILEMVMDDDESQARDKIAAVNTAAKVLGIAKPAGSDSSARTIINFNSSEKPKTEVSGNTITITAN